MKMVIRTPLSTQNITTQPCQTFINNNTLPTWETWHQHGTNAFNGHVEYTRLQKLLDGKMVDGFNNDEHSPKPNCVACTEGKQHVEPFHDLN